MKTLPEEKLLSAVIVQALEDVCLPPIQIWVEPEVRKKDGAPKVKKKVFIMDPDAYSAHEFLFNHGSVYLELLNIDPQEFRKRILLQLQDVTTNRPFDISSRPNKVIRRRKRLFKRNRILYERRKWGYLQPARAA